MPKPSKDQGLDWTFEDPRQFDDELTPADWDSRIAEAGALAETYANLASNPAISEAERTRLQAYEDFCQRGTEDIRKTVRELKIEKWLEDHYGA